MVFLRGNPCNPWLRGRADGAIGLQGSLDDGLVLIKGPIYFCLWMVKGVPRSARDDSGCNNILGWGSPEELAPLKRGA